jgi:hypothetical protein
METVEYPRTESSVSLGEPIKAKLSQSDRNKRFAENHNLKQKIDCPICLGQYTYYSKSKHLKSKHHTNAIKIRRESTDMFLDIQSV